MAANDDNGRESGDTCRRRRSAAGVRLPCALAYVLGAHVHEDDHAAA